MPLQLKSLRVNRVNRGTNSSAVVTMMTILRPNVQRGTGNLYRNELRRRTGRRATNDYHANGGTYHPKLPIRLLPPSVGRRERRSRRRSGGGKCRRTNLSISANHDYRTHDL